MILETYHMANPRLDVVNTAADDVLSERRQREIAEVIERLVAYAPTKLALETTPGHAVELNALHAAYRRGEHALTRDERQQLGFRLAARLGHSAIHGADTQIPIDEAMAAAASPNLALVPAQSYLAR
jgi:hypothetical protein